MKPARAFASQSVEPSGIPGEAVLPSAEPKRLLDGMVAVGISMAEALAAVLKVHGEGLACPLWNDFLGDGLLGCEAMTVLDALAEAAPEVANAWLNQALEQGKIQEWREAGLVGIHLDGRGWVRTLPCGLKVKGTLSLESCDSLVFLPEGLEVGRHLLMIRCCALAVLPDGLKVGGSLDLTGCESLKNLPEGLKVGMDMILSGCFNLESIPQGLKVRRHLYCPASLVSLCIRMQQEGLIHVGGDIREVGYDSWG